MQGADHPINRLLNSHFFWVALIGAYPGEIEYRTEQTRRKDGIFVEDETWGQISDLMQDLNVAKDVGQP